MKTLFKYKSDLISIISLITIFSILLIIYWGHMGDIIVDCGKEAYIPQQMLRGEILGKDLNIAVYGPLGYQLNAFLFYLFGEHLNVLFTAGAINAVIVLISLYFISRNLASITVSWVYCFLIITIFFFTPSISNYIFPYIFDIIYSVNAFLLSIVLCLFYIRYQKPYFIIISALLFGISLAFKYEFSLFIIILAFILLVYKPLKVKYIILSIICIILPPILSYGILILQSNNLNYILNYLKLAFNLAHSPTTKYFFTDKIGLYPSFTMIITTITIFLSFVIGFSFISSLIYTFFKSSNNLKSTIRVSLITVFLVLTACIFVYYSQTLKYEFFVSMFCWMPITTTVLFLIYSYKTILLPLKHIFISSKLNKENINIYQKVKKYFIETITFVQLLDLKQATLIFIFLCAIVSVIKGFFFITLEVYGPFLLPLALLLNILFIIEIIPDYIKLFDQELLKKTILIVLMLIGISTLIKFYSIIKLERSYPVNSSRGTIYTYKYVGIACKDALKFINSKTPQTSTFLMVPESTMLNFLSYRATGNINLNLLPINIEIYGEKTIIKDLKAHSPDYILINNHFYTPGLFGKDYAKGIYKFINDHYTYQTRFGKKFTIEVYKKSTIIPKCDQ